MKILIVSEDIPNPHLGGLGKHALALAHELHRTGHAVDVLGNADHPIDATPEQRGPGQFFGAITGHQRGWKQQALGAYHPWANRLNAGALAKAIVAHASGYDVVHYHGHLPWVAQQLPASLPFTQTRHDQGGDCMLRTRFRPEAVRCESRRPEDCAACATPRPNRLQRALSAWSVRDMRTTTAAAYESRPVIFVSDFLRQAFARVSGKGPQGTVIHNSVRLDELQRAVATAAPTERATTSVDLFAAGALFAYKGFRELLESLKSHGLPDGWRLSIAGSGPELESLRSSYEGAKVRFFGWCDYRSVLAHTMSADAVIVPSVWEEPFATTVLEALALGRVVYALNRGGTPEIATYAGPAGGRLRLFDTMDELVAGVLARGVVPQDPVESLAQFSVGVAGMAQDVLAHYVAHFGPR